MPNLPLPVRFYADPSGVIYRRARCEGCGTRIWHAPGRPALTYATEKPHTLEVCRHDREAIQLSKRG
jgi:hypothetical protein